MLDAQQLLWTRIAAGVCLLISASLFWSLIRLRAAMRAAINWLETEGVIIVSEVDHPAQHVSDDLNDASPIVRYRYRSGGKDFESSKVRIGGQPLTTRVQAIRLVAKYPVGAHVDVYVDANDPACAVLEPAEPGNVAAILVLSVAFGTVAAVLVAHAISGKVIYAGNGVPIFAYLLPIVAIMIAIFGIASFVMTRQKASASARWPTVPGTVMMSDVIEEQIEERGTDKSTSRMIHRYQIDLRYLYRIGKRDYVGLNTNWDWTPIYGSRDVAEAAAHRYTKGQPVTVYYDPAKPVDAVLEPGNRTGSAAPLTFGVISGVAGLAMLTFFIKVGFSS